MENVSECLVSDVSNQKEYLQYDCNMWFVCDCQSEICDVVTYEAEWPGDVPDDADDAVDEWLEEGEEKAVVPEGEKMEVEAEAGKKDQEKVDVAEWDVRNECTAIRMWSLTSVCILCANCVGGTQDLVRGWLVISFVFFVQTV